MWWVDHRYCTSRSVGNYTDGWVVDYQNEKCAKDCYPADGPPCSEIGHDDASAPIYDTAEACCGRLDWISASSCVAASEDNSTGSSVLPLSQFFPDYASSSCLQDCEPGPFGCMPVPPPVALYESIDACCSTALWWVDHRYCTSRSVGNYTDGWVVDYQNAKCAKDCYSSDGPPCSEIGHDDASAPIYDTVEACCDRIDWIGTSSCVAASEDNSTGSSVIPLSQFFPDYASSSCLKDCEPGPFGCMPVPPPVALYDSIDACCSTAMWWVDHSYCTSRSVGNYTDGWVVDFQNEKCVKDCNSASGPPCYEVGNEDTSAPIFDTAEACCGRLDWISTSSCVSASTYNYQDHL